MYKIITINATCPFISTQSSRHSYRNILAKRQWLDCNQHARSFAWIFTAQNQGKALKTRRILTDYDNYIDRGLKTAYFNAHHIRKLSHIQVREKALKTRSWYLDSRLKDAYPGAQQMRKLSQSQVNANSLATRKLSVGQRLPKICCWPKPDYGPLEVFRSEFLNGIRVAAAKPWGAQISACTVMFRAGSRSEVDDELGATHFLRAASALSGCAYSGYIKTRYLQQQGGYITVASDRQTISFTLRCPYPFFSELKYYLLDTAVRCCYAQHEVDQKVKPIVQADLKRRPLEEHCMDLIQQACWAGPLSNSIYCPDGRIADMSEQTLVCYSLRNFTTNRCSIGSCGVPFEETLKVAELIECGKTARPPEICEMPSFPRAGYEEHHYGRGDTYVAFAVPTDGCTADIGLVYSYAILAETLGSSHIAQSTHEWDRVTTPPLGSLAGCDVFTTYRAFNIAYADRGMFGIMVKSTSKYVRDAACRAAEFFCCIPNITCEQIMVGKQRLKVSLCVHSDDCMQVSEGLALQSANCHAFDDARVAMSQIDQVSVEDVMCAAKKVSDQTSKMAMAVVGDLDACPDDKELIR